jgi:hypothetical protein
VRFQRHALDHGLQLPLDTLDRETQWREIMRIGEIH